MGSETINLKFSCNEIVFSEESNWDEFINISFIGNLNSYITLSSVSDEDEIHIEYNEQTNFLSLLKKDINVDFQEINIVIKLTNVLKRNNFIYDHLEIAMPKLFDKNKINISIQALQKIK
jgi:hypothetical protein